jgi:hypothetical protein
LPLANFAASDVAQGAASTSGSDVVGDLVALWPEFQQISAALRTYVDQTTDRILADVFHDDGSDATAIATTLRPGAIKA